MDKLRMQTANKADENFRKLAALFPNAVTETINENGEVVRAIDKDVLMQEIACTVVDGNEERYQFTWPDKKKSVLLANAPINKTLRPCREESVDFDTTENLYIEGDNLEVLKLLQETYLGKIKMIYIDPPYNTGNDFVYEDDFAQSTDEYLANSGQFDEDGNRMVQNTESNGRFHTDWLNMIYPRLKLAKDLLADDGLIFISIDDNEQENLKKCCDEIFGSQNYIGTLIRKVMEGGKADSTGLAIEQEYCHIYGKNAPNGLYKKQSEHLDHYNKQDEYFSERGFYYLKPLENGGLGYVPTLDYPITGPDGVDIYPGDYHGDNGYRWVWGKEKVERALKLDMIVFTPSQKDKAKYKVYYKTYEKVDTDGNPSVKQLPYPTLYLDGYTNRQAVNDLKRLFDKTRVFDYPKPISFLQEVVAMASKDDCVVMDFFSGSGGFAQAVIQQNVADDGRRKFILVQLPEATDEKSEAYKAGYKNICEIGKERIRRAGKKIKEDSPLTTQNLDIGFRVLKCDTSNMKEVYYNPAEYEAGLFSHLEDNIKEDRTPEDLLFQVMLDLGVLLSGKIEETTIAGKKVFNVEDNYLIACFDSNVTEETIKAIAKQKPYYFVMRDSSMANDSVATNFDQIFATYSPDTVRKVL